MISKFIELSICDYLEVLVRIVRKLVGDANFLLLLAQNLQSYL
jgi:hypothetical protein